MHGAGARAVTALSDWAEATVCRDGRVDRQRYERGLAVADVCDTGPAGTRTGTAITFHPDPEIFPDAAFDRDRLGARLRELAFLNRGLVTRLTEERTGRDDTFHYPGGVADFVTYLNRGAEVLHEPITIHEEVRAVAVRVEVAMQYTTRREGQIRCYTNNAYNFLGGTHLRGFGSALTRTLGRWARTERLSQQSPAPTGKDFRDGLTAVVSVKLPGPQFLSQTQCLLYNPEVTGALAGVVRKGLTRFLAENPEVARRISTKVVAAAKARTARGPSKDQG